MGAMASQITSLTIVYSVYSGTDQRKHQSSASLAFVRGIHRGPVISPHKWPVTRKMFPFDDVIMFTGILTISLIQKDTFWIQWSNKTLCEAHDNLTEMDEILQTAFSNHFAQSVFVWFASNFITDLTICFYSTNYLAVSQYCIIYDFAWIILQDHCLNHWWFNSLTHLRY